MVYYVDSYLGHWVQAQAHGFRLAAVGDMLQFREAFPGLPRLELARPYQRKQPAEALTRADCFER